MNFVDQIQPEWTLFLDRDGVINVRPLNDYVRRLSDFTFLEGVEELGEFEENFKEEEEEFGWDDDLDLGAGDDFDDYQSYDEDDDY